MDINLIAAPAAGAVIGYFTNWLAIKMLFRPHSQKMFLGMRMPFSPGLIPKEKGRIASTVGQAVGNYILTDEILADSLSSESVKKNISDMIDEAFEKAELSNKDNSEILSGFLGNNVDISQKISEYISSGLEKILFSRETEEKISAFVYEKAKNALKSEFENIDHKSISEALKNALSKIDRSSAEAFIEKNIWNWLLGLKNDERKLYDVFSPSAVQEIKDYISLKIPPAVNYIISLTENPETEKILKEKIDSAIKKTVGPFAGIFVKTDNIYVSIIEGVTKYINDPKNMPEIDAAVSTAVDHMLQKTVGNAAAAASGEMRETTINKTVSFLTGEIAKDGNIDKLVNNLTNFIKERGILSPIDMLDYLGINCDEKLALLSKKITKNVLSPKTYEMMLPYINKAVDKALKTNVFSALNRAPNEIRETVKSVIISVYMRLIPKIAPKLLSSSAIAEIVEKQINSFSPAYMEELTFTIANKEFKTITAVGGVLGFFIGIIPALINYIW